MSKTKPEAEKKTKKPEIDLTGISNVLDDEKSKTLLAQVEALRVELSQTEPQSPSYKEKKKDLLIHVDEATSRVKLIGSLLYSRCHRENTFEIKTLKKAIRNAKEEDRPLSEANLQSAIQAAIEKEKALELDKVNALHRIHGKDPVNTDSGAWQSRYFFWRLARPFVNLWNAFSKRFPNLAQFIAFLMISNGITIIQIALQNLMLPLFNNAGLANVTFQLWAIPGATCVNFYQDAVHYTQYYIFDYYKGALESTVVRDGITMMGGGGLAYFLSVQVTGAIAQVLNFFAQRKVTFKSHSNVGWAAFWYTIAYFAIMIISSALQGLYKAPIYQFFINNHLGMFLPNLITMIIYCAVSFWVFYPIFKFIFPSDEAIAKKAEKKAKKQAK
jgi:hypothetical protein